MYSGKHLFLHDRLQLSFVYKNLPQISFNLFCSGDKRLLSDFLRKWGWFHGHDVHLPKDLGSKLSFQKTETKFFIWKSNDYNNINIFLSLKSPCTFVVVKEKTWKRIFNSNSKLFQNHAEKQLMLSKATVNWLFNEIGCYLVIDCFDWKIDAFQQTVVRVYCNLILTNNTILSLFNFFFLIIDL